jgi:hypothetical protein
MRALGFLAVVVSLVACGSTPAPSPPTTTAPPPPAAGSGAADPDEISLYRDGRFTRRPRAFATDADGCIGTAIDAAGCAQVAPAKTCELAPWPDAGAVYCSGAAMGPEHQRPRAPPPCGCTCSADYQKAYGELMARVDACGRVP